MPDLTFGEQVKIVLSRKGMTIKELAKKIEQRTGKKMSRQNLTQRLGRDNFQEKDMRMIASILECPLKLSILGEDTPDEKEIANIADSLIEEKGSEHAEGVSGADTEETIEQKDIKAEALEKKDTEQAAVEEEGTGQAVFEEEGTGQAAVEEGTEQVVFEEEGSEQAASDGKDTAKEAFGEQAAATEAVATEAPEEEAADGGDSGRDITVGEFLEIRKSSGESAQEQLMQELLAEMDSIEREGRERNAAWELRRQEKEQQEAEKKTEKKGGFMSRFRFRKREEAHEPEEYSDEKTEAAVSENDTDSENAASNSMADGTETAGMEDSSWEDSGQESTAPRQANTFSDRIKEYTLQDNELLEQLYEDEEEDLAAGDVNPYTGHEYLSNSVRMHPKRIGYVQVYNRKDHRWTDMTEWAFLGYQERKKVLLGKDYEPPIYLD